MDLAAFNAFAEQEMRRYARQSVVLLVARSPKGRSLT